MGSLIKGVRNQAHQRRARTPITLDCRPIEAAIFEFELAGLPVLASVTDIGSGEISVKALVAPTELGRSFVKTALFHGHRCGSWSRSWSWFLVRQFWLRRTARESSRLIML